MILKQNSRFRSFLVNALIVLGSTVLILSILEVGFRVVLGERIALYPRYHSAVRYGKYLRRRLRPNTVFWHTSVAGSWKFTINSQGYRSDREFSYRKNPAVTRVVALGDSHTQGFEARQDRTFSAVIERYLRRRGKRVEVYNMGVSGFGTDEELLLLENEIVKYKPDYVVLAFYANDYEDNLKTGLFTLDRNRLKADKKEYVPGVRILDFLNRFYTIRKLSENSYLYSYALNTVSDIIKFNRLRQVKPGATAGEKAVRSYAVSTKTGRTTRELRLAELLLKRIVEVCRKNRIRLIIIDLPQPNNERSLARQTYGILQDQVELLINGARVIEPYRGLVDLKVSHGQQHISEFTHVLIGVKVGRYLESRL